MTDYFQGHYHILAVCKCSICAFPLFLLSILAQKDGCVWVQIYNMHTNSLVYMDSKALY